MKAIKIKKFLFILLSAALLYACTGERDNPRDPKGTNYKGTDDEEPEVIDGPLFDPAAGTLVGQNTVRMYSEFDGARVIYTTDGTDPVPGENGTLSNSVIIKSQTTLRAMLILPDGATSLISEAEYKVKVVPIFDLFNGGIIGGVPVSTDISISTSPAGGTVKYTTDGSDPKTSGTTGSNITIDTELTIKAFASLAGCIDSDVIESSYSFPVTWTTIKNAVLNSVSGDTINIPAGTYTEGLINLDKKLSLRGAAGHASILDGTRFVVQSDDIELHNLKMLKSTVAVSVNATSGGPYSGLTIKNTVIEECSTALTFINGNFSDLLIEDSAFDNNVYGLSFTNLTPSAPDKTLGYNFDRVTVKRSTFNSNTHKGIFLEALSDALFEDIEVSECAQVADRYDNGLDINLKYGDYSNLTFRRILIKNNGAVIKEGFGFIIKARDDPYPYSGSTTAEYDKYPATLSGVTIEDGTISGNNTGFSAGAFKGISGLKIRNVIFENNLEKAVGSYYNTEIDAKYNWWGHASGPETAGNPEGTGDKIDAAFPSTTLFNPWITNKP